MKICNSLLISSMLACSAMLAQAGDLAEVKEQGTLRVALYKDYPPYSYLAKGKMQGLDVDIAKALAERLEVGTSIMQVTASDEAMEDDLRNAIWKGHYLGGGVADVMLHVPIDPEFAEENDQVRIFGPYLREQIVIAHNVAKIPDMNNLLVFTREKIGVELETIADTFLARAERGRLVNNVIHFRQLEQVCNALLQKDVAAIMGPRAQLEHCIGDNTDFAISAVPARVGLFSWTVGMAVKSDYQELADALDQALTELKNTGTLETIFQRHGISYTKPGQ